MRYVPWHSCCQSVACAYELIMKHKSQVTWHGVFQGEILGHDTHEFFLAIVHCASPVCLFGKSHISGRRATCQLLPSSCSDDTQEGKFSTVIEQRAPYWIQLSLIFLAWIYSPSRARGTSLELFFVQRTITWKYSYSSVRGENTSVQEASVAKICLHYFFFCRTPS